MAAREPAGKTRVKNDHNDAGAILILALVFLIVVSATVAVLTTWASNDLKNTNNFQDAQSMDYAVTSAMETAINSIRYTPLVGTNQTLNASPPNYCWGTSAPSSLTTDGVSVAVWCSTFQDLQSQQTRTVTLSACKSSVSAAACSSTPTLQAVVIFNDYPPSGATVLTQSCTTYCGEGATLESWDWGSKSTNSGTLPNSIDVTSTPPVLAPLNSTYQPIATATSGDTVVITATPTTICSYSSATGLVTFKAAGTCLVDFNDPGNVNFEAAAQVQQSVSVGLLANTITVNSTPSNPTALGPSYTPNATATSGDTVQVTSATTSICTASSNVVSFTAPGTCTLDFNDPGNSTYGAAAQVTQTFSVAQAATAGSNVEGIPNPQDGVPDNGDAIQFTYNQTMSASSLMSGFSGSSTSVYVKIARSYGASSTTLTVCTSSSCGTSVNLGSLNLGDSSSNAYLAQGKSTIFNATMTMSTASNDSVVTVTLGTVNSGTTPSALVPTTTQTTLTWTPSSSATSSGGVACSTNAVTESGAPKLNF